MLIIGDLHLGLTWDGLDRTQDVFDILYTLPSLCDQDIKSVVFLGDIFENVTVSHSCVAQFIDFLSELKYSNSSGRDIWILAGNHDGVPEHRRGSPLEEVAASKIAKVIWEPQFVQGVGFMLPHGYEDIKTSDVPKGCDVFTHVDIPGAIPGFEVQIGRGLPVSMPDWLPKKAHRVFSGHIHKPQQIDNIAVVGSLISTDLSEVGDKKRVLTTRPNETGFEELFINNRPLVGVDTIYGSDSYEKVMTALNESLAMCPNAIASVKIVCPHTKAHETEWDKLEDSLRKSCHYLRWSLNVVKAKEIRVKDLDMTKTDGEIVSEFVRKQKLSDEKEVLACLEEILT